MAILFVNDFQAQIQNSIGAADTTVALETADYDALPSMSAGDYLIALLDNGTSTEYVHITAKLTSPDITIERGKEGTDPISAASASVLTVVNSAGMYEKFTQDVDLTAHAETVDAHHTRYTDAEASAAAPVQSVAGKTGTVALTNSDVGLGNVPNEDATDPYNMDQKGAADGQALVWSNTNVRWEPSDVDLPAILTPSITSPTDGATGTNLAPTIKFSPYYSLYGKAQQALQVVIATDSNFTTIVHDKTLGAVSQWTVSSSLAINTQHWVKGRYQDEDNVWSEYSAPISFTTANVYIQAPTITNPADGATDIGETVTFTTGAFSCVNGADSHASSSWWLYDNTTDTLVWSSVGDAINLTSIDLPAGNVETSTEYRLEVLHTGETYGDSAVTSTTYTTSDTFGGVIGVPGTQGFGVGIYPGTLPSGFSELTGTTDETNDNYGNYQYSDGSICVFIPKFYYRVNNINNPTHADYAPNDIDIKGINDFADEAAANVAGYALHRAFIDGGVVKSGFFFDKYMASKHGTADAALSAANGVPLSLTDDTSYTNTASLTGCSGILADAVVLSRARGSGWNAPSVFMYSALRMLSLAHAQAATGTTNCAWYDPTDTTNYPKGCNSALGDVDDAEISYTTAGDSGNADKPLTGSGTPFAKTTHNGQACGVADLNGGMREACLGMTQIGTSATDTGTESDESIYLLKEGTALANLTSGWDGSISTNDAWGNTTHLGNLYDLVTCPHDLGTNTGWMHWGNSSNQVLSAATSGVARNFCGVVPMDDSASSASGTNLFGVDGFYRYNRHNMVPLSCGYWGGGADAGVWYLYCNGCRSLSNYVHGFRAVAYGS